MKNTLPGALEFRSWSYRIQLGLLTVKFDLNATGINDKGCLPHDAQNLFNVSLKDEEMDNATSSICKVHMRPIMRPQCVHIHKYWFLVFQQKLRQSQSGLWDT